MVLKVQLPFNWSHRRTEWERSRSATWSDARISPNLYKFNLFYKSQAGFVEWPYLGTSSLKTKNKESQDKRYITFKRAAVILAAVSTEMMVHHGMILFRGWKKWPILNPKFSENIFQRERWNKDPLEEEMASHHSILAWKIPQTEEPGGLQSMGLQRVEHDWASMHTG